MNEASIEFIAFTNANLVAGYLRRFYVIFALHDS